MSFANLKRNRGSVEALVKAAAAATTKKRDSGADARFWKPTIDQGGKGSAVIRFMPAPEGEDLPWVQFWDHGFKGETTGLWYIEKSLTSIGQEDPVSEYNKKLWNSGREEDKEIVRKQKRRLHYVANILVVKDSGNAENEGKIFLYKFGKKIFDKIMEQMQPEFPDQDPVNPFDMWEGANLSLRIRTVAGFINYDLSKFDNPAPVSSNDAVLEKYYASLSSLKEFTDPAQYKPYAELEARLNKVIGTAAVKNTGTVRTQVDLDVDDEIIVPPPITLKKPTPRQAASAVEADAIQVSESELADEDTMAYFAKLAAED